MPELPVGFLRRDIRVNMDDGGVARIVILDVESPFQITPHYSGSHPLGTPFGCKVFDRR
jgi:hypothetical protein